MTRTSRNPLDDLRGASRLAIEATRGVTDLVEAMHLTIGGGPALLGRPLRVPTRAITGLVYGSIRGVPGGWAPAWIAPWRSSPRSSRTMRPGPGARPCSPSSTACSATA